jgi:hypothetical protein
MRIIFLLVLVLGASGCTTSPLALKVLYGQFDNFMKRELLSYADFTAEQRELIESEVDSLVQWHRYQALPDYAENISTAQRKLLDSPINPNDIDWLFETLRALATEFESRSPILSLRPMIIRLNDEQIQQINKTVVKELAKERKELEKAKRRDPAKESVKNLSKFFKRLGVTLSKAQKQNAERYFSQRKISNLQRHAVWGKWVAELSEILNNRAAEEFSMALESHYTSRFSLIEEVYPDEWQKDQQLTKAMLLELFRSLNKTQQDAMRERLKSLSTVALDLARND